MCRCCQSCWEDFKWNCFEERFCYDESIANYNPEEDFDYMTIHKNGSALSHIQISDNNNLTVPIVNQPVHRSNSGFFSGAKIHEDDYRREIQTNVPMLGPEILAVFANSQIFQDHQPTKLSRISTRTFLAGIHSPNKEVPTTPRESDQDRLLRRLEGNNNNNNSSNNNNNKNHNNSQNNNYNNNKNKNHNKNNKIKNNNNSYKSLNKYDVPYVVVDYVDDDDDDNDDDNDNHVKVHDHDDIDVDDNDNVEYGYGGLDAQPYHPLKRPSRKNSNCSCNGTHVGGGNSSNMIGHHKVKFYLN